MKPLIALVGRPNVGKSTLFNRILRQRSAIVDSTPGVTRDRHIAEGEWQGKQFLLMDTGGYNTTQNDIISAAMLEQTLTAISDADTVIFVTDVRSGLTYDDLELAKLLRRNFTDKPVFFAVNKVESPSLSIDAESFISTGFTRPYQISAKDGSGVADLLDDVLESLPSRENEEEEKDPAVKIAVVGRPNVGKSSFVNALLGSNRLIVSSIPGTTRDAIDSRFMRNRHEYVLIDTAGLRKRTKIDAGIEFYSSLRTEKAIERCDVTLVLLDADAGLEKQDMKIINIALERKKGVLLLVNKWDLIEKDSKTSKLYEENLRSIMGNLSFIPVLFVSALTKKNLYRAIDAAKEISDRLKNKIPTSKLNNFLAEALARKNPSTKSGRELKIKYMTQIESPWPVFAFFCNDPELVQDNFRKFLEKRLREHFPLEGVPVSLRFMRK
ncbi:MAG: ribosome biogenesis GTPase Der [Chlorobiaceae bacterium]|nr:ribosome biogenesis GTPase Der [Chlorobiaceae bacterium]